MEKETLTNINIKSDILPLLLGDVVGVVIAYITLLVLGTLTDLFLRNIGIITRIRFILFIILTIAALLALVYVLVLIYKTHKMEFITKTCILVSKKEGGGHPGTTVWTGYKPYTLRFNMHNEFCIPVQLNYKWSSLHSMDEKGVFNSSNLNDKFLLVSLNGWKKTIMVYNLNLFDFQT